MSITTGLATVHRAPEMRGIAPRSVLPVREQGANEADSVPCEQLQLLSSDNRYTMGRRGMLFLALALMLLSSGCGGDSFLATDVRVLQYHFGKCLYSVEEFTKRLYAKNPKYEPDPLRRQAKIDSIFCQELEGGEFDEWPSERLLTAAFSLEPPVPDRVYLLGLGLAKSIREAYGLGDGQVFFLGLQVELEQLENLHHNLTQVNWRLKTYRDEKDRLMFLTNAVGEDGYINMGYEVIMTEILTRVQDDIYLRGGLPGKYFFDMSTMFVSILL